MEKHFDLFKNRKVKKHTLARFFVCYRYPKPLPVVCAQILFDRHSRLLVAPEPVDSLLRVVIPPPPSLVVIV